ncbi:MAG: hypothetical protein WBP64_03050 [Nitrososphaeraceae archaeon]
MIHGVLTLLDALGTTSSKGEDLEFKIKGLDKLDRKIRKNIRTLSSKLGIYGYNNALISVSIYDNIQIFLPTDLLVRNFTDMSGKNPLWWTIVTIGELMIDVFRYALINGVPLRGCITSGYGVMSKSDRILGPIATEASKFYELGDWIGIIASYHTKLVLNSKVSVNPNQEFSEPFTQDAVPIVQNKNSIKWDNVDIVKIQDPIFWSLKWPI